MSKELYQNVVKVLEALAQRNHIENDEGKLLTSYKPLRYIASAYKDASTSDVSASMSVSITDMNLEYA